MSGRGRGGKGKGGEGFSFDFANSKPQEVAEEAEAVYQPQPLPKQVADRVVFLQHLQIQRESVEEDYQKELAALEAKYQALFQPFYEKRSKVIKGELEPSAGDISAAATAVEQRNKQEQEEAGEPWLPATPVTPATQEKGIPGFWLGVLQKSNEFSTLITEADEAALKHLTDITSKELEGGSLELTFQFSTNPFFSNTTLVKKYNVFSQGGQILGPQSVDPCDIQWKDGKKLTHKTVTKQVGGGGRGKRGNRGRGGAGGASKTVTTEEPVLSFFHFFNPQFEEDDEEDEEAGGMLDHDYEAGLTLHEDILPNAILYFSGEPEEEEDFDMMGEGEDDEEDEEDDEEGGAPAPAQGQQQECKQQ